MLAAAAVLGPAAGDAGAGAVGEDVGKARRDHHPEPGEAQGVRHFGKEQRPEQQRQTTWLYCIGAIRLAGDSDTATTCSR